MSRKTVNGIKLKKEIDETTRSIITRSGDIEAQVLKAAELDILDTDYYKKFLRGLKKAKPYVSLAILYATYGFCLVNIGKIAIYILV